VTDAWDDEDRAIARALGADVPVDHGTSAERATDDAPDDEATADDATDDATFADYEAVVAMLPFEAVAPAPELEDRVVAAALARRPATIRSIDPAVRSADTKRNAGKPARAHSTRRWVGAGVAAVAAAAIVVVLLAGRTPSGSGSTGGRIQPAAANGGVARVLAEPGTRQGVLRSPTGVSGGRVVLDPSGSGYLTGLRIPSAGTTEWLWLDTASPVRVGPIPRASTVHFVVHGDVSAVRGVIITTDPAASEPFSLRARLG
jgi:hypothetical protein